MSYSRKTVGGGTLDSAARSSFLAELLALRTEVGFWSLNSPETRV